MRRLQAYRLLRWDVWLKGGDALADELANSRRQPQLELGVLRFCVCQVAAPKHLLQGALDWAEVDVVQDVHGKAPHNIKVRQKAQNRAKVDPQLSRTLCSALDKLGVDLVGGPLVVLVRDEWWDAARLVKLLWVRV